MELVPLFGHIFKDSKIQNKHLRTIKKRLYSAEFKQNVINLSNKHTNIKELATELGVNMQRIYKWHKGALEATRCSESI